MQIDKQKEFRWQGFLVMFYWLGLMAVSMLLVAATYTWFSLSKTPRVNDMDLHVSSPVGLELALEYDSPDEEWGQSLDFYDMVPGLATLKPCTWSEVNQRFFAAAYGTDGRVILIAKPLSDALNANLDGPEGYYAKGTFFARSDTAVTVSLMDAMTTEDGTDYMGTFLIGVPIWNGEMVLHQNGGSGAEYAIRVGFRITPINKAGFPVGDSKFIIYEPNSDGHVSGAEGYIGTPSIDGTNSLVPEHRLIRQSTTRWGETDPVQRDETVFDMGTFQTGAELFQLYAGEMVQIDLYIWLEGQDTDCTFSIGSEAIILSHIQFEADSNSQSGLKPID